MAVPGITTAGATAALDASLNTIMSDFRLLPDDKGIMRDRATPLSLKPGTGSSVIINNYARLSANGIADGADITNPQTLSDTGTSFTPTEVVAQALISGRTLDRVADRSLLDNTAKMIMNALRLKMDADGAAQLPSFTPIVGAAGTVCSPGIIAAAVGKTEIGNSLANPEPYDDISIVLHPLMMLELSGRMVPYSNVPTGTNVYGVDNGAHAGVTLTNSGGTGPSGSLADQIVRQGPRSVAQLQGHPVFLDANISVDSNNDGSGACFARVGLNYVSEKEPTLDYDKTDASMRGAVELNGWYSGIWGLYRASNSGTEILGDCAIPSS